MPQFLLLDVILVYIFNAHIYRPGEGQREGWLLDTAAADESDDEGRFDPYLRGILFVNDIVLDSQTEAYRLNATLRIGVNELATVLGASDWIEVSGKFTVNVLVRPVGARKANPDRIRNRNIAMTSDEKFVRDAPMPLVNWGLKDQGVVLRAAAALTGDDVPAMGIPDLDFDDPEEQVGDNIDDLLQRIWSQFPIDVVGLGPNERNAKASSHIRLSREERDQATRAHR